MSKEDKNKIMKQQEHDEIPNGYKLIAYIVPIGTVSEGSRVFLDGSQSYYKSSNNNTASELPAITTRSIGDKDGVAYLWKQDSGPKIDLIDNYTSMPSFIAPHIEFSHTNIEPMQCIILQFQLIVKDKKGMISRPTSIQVVVKIVQRALVLQGGGALGAYEVGVFKALCENLIEKRKETTAGNRLLFDIVAGTSIGAVNAAIIVRKVLQHYNNNSNNTRNSSTRIDQAEVWTNTVKDLEEFWDDVSNPLSTIPKWMQDNSSFENWWNNWKFINELGDSLFASWWDYTKIIRTSWHRSYDLISKEILQIRKNLENENSNYWSDKNWWNYIPILREEWPYIQWINWNEEEKWKEEWPYIQSYFYWPENFSHPTEAEAARRYYSYANSLSLGVPRVILPAIHQPDLTFFGSPFTRFDNRPLARTIKKYWDYEKFPIKTRFEDFQPRLLLISVDMLDATSAVAFDSYPKEDDVCKTEYGDEDFKHVIEYSDGITMEHVMASMSTHLKHKYPQMKVRYNEDKREETRLFWDGAYLSNTPLKELLHEHQHYWQKVKNEKIILENGQQETLVPNLEIYIINLYPSVEDKMPMTADAIQDREIDIKFHDRTKNDIRFAQITSDYIDFIEQLTNLGLKHAENDEEFKMDYDALLNKLAKSRKRTGISRTFKDLLQGKSDLTKVVYVDRSDDGNTILGKAFEFSSKTVNQLQKAGYEDAELAMDIEAFRSTVINLLDSRILTQQEIIGFEQKLQAAIAQAKHRDIDKAQERLSEMLKIALDTIKGKNLEQKELTRHILEVERLMRSKELVLFQLLIINTTLLVTKGILSQDEADCLKRELREKKKVLKNQGAPIDVIV